jgi:hypothetical protein
MEKDRDAMRLDLDGTPPWFPNLAAVMDPAPDMLDELLVAFAPSAERLDPDVCWTALHCFVLDRLLEDVFTGSVDEAWVRRAAWVSYATGFWCTRSWRGVWAPIDESFSLPTTADSVELMAGQISSKLPAYRASGSVAIARAAELLRLETFHGSVFGAAYNTSYLIVVGEPQPLGQRPPHLTIERGYVRADADHLLDIAYEAPIPGWLVDIREHYSALELTDAAAFRAVTEGADEAASLSDVWRAGFELAPANWGADFIVRMTQEYYDPFVRWSVLYNFGLEAIARASVVAVARQDADLAARALAGNIIFDGSWGSIQLGVLDGTHPLPVLSNT